MADLSISYPGQINLAGDNQALLLKLFSGEVLTSFNVACVYKERQMVRQIKNGKSAQFPATGKITAAYHVPGTQLVGTPVAANERVIVVDDLLVANVMIADIEDAKNHYDVRSEYSKQLGEALAKQYDINVANTAVLAARAAATITGESGGSVIAGGAAIKTTAALIKTALFAAAQKLDENFAPESERWAMVKPQVYYTAAADTTLINKDWGGRGSLADGTIDTVAGIKLVKSNNVPSTNVITGPTKYQGNFATTALSIFQKGAVGTVQLMELSMQQEYLTLWQATAMVARMATGTGILRPELAIEVTAA